MPLFQSVALVMDWAGALLVISTQTTVHRVKVEAF